MPDNESSRDGDNRCRQLSSKLLLRLERVFVVKKAREEDHAKSQYKHPVIHAHPRRRHKNHRPAEVHGSDVLDDEGRGDAGKNSDSAHARHRHLVDPASSGLIDGTELYCDFAGKRGRGESGKKGGRKEGRKRNPFGNTSAQLPSPSKY